MVSARTPLAVRPGHATLPLPPLLRALQLQAHGRGEALAHPHTLGPRLLGRGSLVCSDRGVPVIPGTHVLPAVRA